MELDFRFFFGVSNLSRLGWIFTDVIVVVRATDVCEYPTFTSWVLNCINFHLNVDIWI